MRKIIKTHKSYQNGMTKMKQINCNVDDDQSSKEYDYGKDNALGLKLM